MKYRYVELQSKEKPNSGRTGELVFVGVPSQELIEELELKEERIYHDKSGTAYKTTLMEMGEKGWELQFVTPCGVYLNKGNGVAGPIRNSYIFRKTEDED